MFGKEYGIRVMDNVLSLMVPVLQVFVASVHEPLQQEDNTEALLQPSDSPNAGQPHHYKFPKRSFGSKTIVYRSF